MKAWGLVRWKLAKEANDGRIWPEDIEGLLGPEMSKKRCYGQMAIEYQRGPIGHKSHGVANWSQARIAATPMKEGRYSWL
ncbi:hypothetical protein O181_088998 [Austropuccinia psidii MF-1]|uniref:Uncharacterized protein n=1 Tax=Austropuccinia psidii MF-1 TaxID=1389203 RepID=A0A9Q3ISN2_9BASI|nr:hypothetical protein [Austropuccinia psidii MF-1]